MKLIYIISFLGWALGLITGVSLGLSASALPVLFLFAVAVVIIFGLPWVIDHMATPLTEELEHQGQRLARLEAHHATTHPEAAPR